MQLHGDAHVEQYALTKDAWGLDDFDDSARGPALVDIVRFLGSIDLAVRRRGWSRERDRMFDRFLAGYRRGLSEPSDQPPEPDIVRVLRAQAPGPTNEAFLEWAEAKMEPMPPAQDDKGLARIKTDTALRYRPPSEGAGQGGLPFKIKGADLKSTNASGTILFNIDRGRVENSSLKMELKG